MLFDLRNGDETKTVLLALEEKRKEGKTIGLTSGCFDLIHFQHFYYFFKCRRRCDVLIVGVDSDEMVCAEKGPERPFIFDYKRATMVDALKPVSFAFVMNDLGDLRSAAKLIRPDFLFRNSDFAGREKEVVGCEFAGQLVIVHDVEDHASTTALCHTIAGRIKQ